MDSKWTDPVRHQVGGAALALLVALVLLPASASAGSFHVIFPQQLEATVVQGQSTTFTMDVHTLGAVPCSSTTAPVRIDGLYSVDAVGDIAAGQPTDMAITTADPRGSSDNCSIQDPVSVPLTVTAAAETPVGDYTTTVMYGRRGEAGEGLVGPPLTIHVVAPDAPQPEVLPTPQLEAPQQIVLGERETPRPVLGKSLLLTRVSGVVRYRSPGRTVTTLTGAAVVPNGTFVDARAGVVKVTVVRDRTGALDSVDTWGGTYVANQNARPARALTSFTLTSSATGSRSKLASAAKRRGNRLWANGKGNFRTRGKRASAIVRGTYWLTQDTPSGTKVAVRRGLVAVRDFVRHHTVLVSQGHSYTAKLRAVQAIRRPVFTGRA